LANPIALVAIVELGSGQSSRSDVALASHAEKGADRSELDDEVSIDLASLALSLPVLNVLQ
jgi:hypothetical protein